MKIINVNQQYFSTNTLSCPHGSPSPPPSKGGGGGGSRRPRSHSPHGGKKRDARNRLNEYAYDYAGPKCFADRIREEEIPKGLNFKLPGNQRPYDGSERPDVWIMDFFNAVRLIHGSANLACLLLQNYLVGPARIWLNDLPENSIWCWFDLKVAFEAHFRGTYKRPHTASDLQMCIQRKDETSR